MTVTLVYGDAADGYLHSFASTYATARNGPANGATGGTVAYYGQNNNGGTFAVFQTFIRFAYPAVASTDLVVSATIRVNQASQLSTGVARDLELKGAPWGTSLTTADWRTPTQLASAGLFGLVRGVQASSGKATYAGSESLRSGVQSFNYQELVLVTSRQRAGTTPTSDEGASIWTAEYSGTAMDPLLAFTTVPTGNLTPIMGMEVQLSDGSWAFGRRVNVSSGGPVPFVALYRQDTAGGTTLIGELPLGTGTSAWGDVPGAQGMTLAVDAADNLYVVGRAGDAANSIRHRAYVKAPSSWSWTAGTIRTAALPAHDAPVNNLVAAWHSTAGGTLAVFASHASGDGVSTGTANDLSWALLNTQYLLTGSGTHVRATGSAQTIGLVPTSPASGDFNGYANEVGSGLDVVADRGQADWGYITTFKRSQRVGDNLPVMVGRYILLSTGTGFSHVSYQDAGAYGRKDATGKLRIMSVGSGQVAVVSADADSGYGLSLQVLQASGTTPGFVALGYVALAGEGLSFMPDGPAVASSLAWDAIYNRTENAVWVYYVDVTDPLKLRRTSVSLDTYQATRVEVLAYTSTAAIQAVRAPRNSWATQRGHVTLAVPGGYRLVVETFNQPPLAPTLTARGNYDASVAADFAWTFQDPNTEDTQSAYQLQVQRVDTGATVLDTGKVASAASVRTVAGGTLANGLDYRWRVTTWDALDVAGPWSDWGTFTTSAGGSVNITVPAVDNPPGVTTNDFQVAWTVTGTTQVKMRAWVTRNDTGAVVHDSGWLTDSFPGWLVRYMVSDVEHTVRVQVENASGVRSGIGTRLITPTYATPEAPLVVVTPVPAGGYVLVDVDNPIPGEVDSGFPFWDMEGAPDLGAWYKNGGTLAVSTAQVYRGSQSAAFVSTGSGVAHAYNRAPAVLVTPGQRYAVRAWLYADVARDVSLAIDWLTSGGAYVSGSSTTVTLAAGIWTAVEASGTAPATAARASYGWGITLTPPAGATVWADDLRLAPASDRPEVVRNRVLRRKAGTTDPWEVLGTCDPDGAFRDYTAPSQVPVEYKVRGETA